MNQAPGSSIFNPDFILQGQNDQAMSTRAIPIPVGTYLAQIMELTPRNVQGVKDTSKFYQFLDIKLEIKLSQEAQAELGRETATRNYSVSLDLTEQGNLDYGKGKNIGLGRLREAVGQNVPGQAWSPMMLKGQVIRVSIKHEPDPRDSNNTLDKIDKIGSATAETL